MRYYPNYNISMTFVLWSVISLILTSIAGLIYWIATVLIKLSCNSNLFYFNAILYFYIFCLVVILLFILFKKLNVKYIDVNLNDHSLLVKHFSHRHESDLKIMLNQIKLIEITGIINHEKHYKVVLKNDKAIIVDLTAIPDKDLNDFSNIYNYKIEMNLVSD